MGRPRAIRLSSYPRTFRTSQDPTNTPTFHGTFLPELTPSQTSPVKRPITPDPVDEDMRTVYSPYPSPSPSSDNHHASFGGIEELSDSQWDATQWGNGVGGGSSQTDIYGLEEEGRRIVAGEEKRLSKRKSNDSRRNELDALRAKRSKKSPSPINSPPPSSPPIPNLHSPPLETDQSGSGSGSSSTPIDLSDSPAHKHHKSTPMSWSASPAAMRISKENSVVDDDRASEGHEHGDLMVDDRAHDVEGSWEQPIRKKRSKKLVIASDEEESEEDDHIDFQHKPTPRLDKGKSKALQDISEQHKTPTLGDLFMDDEDADPTFDPHSEPHPYDEEEDEYDTIFDTHYPDVDFDSLELELEHDSDPPPFPITTKPPNTGPTRTPLKTLTTIPSSASTSHMLITPGKCYTDEVDEEPLMLIQDLPEDVQDFYLNHWRRGADDSRAGEEEYEEGLREKREQARRKGAAAARGRFGRGGGSRGKSWRGGRGKGKAKARKWG